MPKSQIVGITVENPFSPEAGVNLYPAIVILANGESGTIYMQNQLQYTEGDFIDYEKIGNKIKVKKNSQPASSPVKKEPKSFRTGVKNPEDYLGFIYGYAKDIHIAEMQIAKKPISLENLKRNVEEIYVHLQEVLSMRNL